MAEEIQASMPTGPNGERLELRVGSKSLGLSVKDLIPVLLLILIGILGHYRTQALDRDMERLYARQDKIFELLDRNHATTLGVLHENEGRVQAALQVIQQFFRVHDFNQDKAPGERLPLDIPPEQMRPPPGRQ